MSDDNFFDGLDKELVEHIDLDELKKEAKALAKDAAEASADFGKKFVKYNLMMEKIAIQVQSGAIDNIAARRAHKRFQRAIRNAKETLTEFANWKRVDAWMFTMDKMFDLLDFAREKAESGADSLINRIFS
jgi:hypothetical protein